MKKMIALFWVLIILLTAISAFAEDASIWEVKEYVDEFNDPTGEKYIVAGPFEGTFSNSATTNSELKAYVFCDNEKVWLRLFEYGDSQVNNPNSEIREYQIKTKVGLDHFPSERIFAFKGSISGGSGDMYIYNQLYTDNYSGELGASEISGVRYENLLDVLKRSTSIKFAITGIDFPLDKYNFSISNAGNLEDALQSIITFEVAIGTKVRDKQYGEGVITEIYYDEGKKLVRIKLTENNSFSLSYQIPWAFEEGYLSIIE